MSARAFHFIITRPYAQGKELMAFTEETDVHQLAKALDEKSPITD